MDKKILMFFLLLALPLSFLGHVHAETEKEKAEKEFQQLKADFEDEISYPPYSDYEFEVRYWDSESGRKIIAIGKKAIPFIMQEIKNGLSRYTVAASMITGIKMRGPTADDLIKQWLDWWEDNINNPEWNMFIE